MGAIYMFTIMASDFVAKAVYNGEPTGKAGSGSVDRYQQGVRMASWGLLVYNLSYMLMSLVHVRVLAVLGQKVEFVLVSLVLGCAMVLLAWTARLEVFFLLSAAAGLQRCCFYVVPFAVANDLTQPVVETEAQGGSPRVGLTMSLVTGMVPLAYMTLFPWVGRLEELSGVVATPLWLGAAYTTMSACLFVKIR
nr:hypothetical protein BaRGS_030446 [Batillaria attramentaria]